ncbi:hypothetical protein N9L68_03660 [bacterium]|nr:hypothetical protein [bacterium]
MPSETVVAGRSVGVMQQLHGLKFNADGVLFKQHLRGLHKPIEHYIRYWMHVLVSGGVANAQTGVLLE